MSMNVGELYAVLGAVVDPRGFAAYERELNQAQRRAAVAENRMRDSHARSSSAMQSMGRTAKVVAVGGLLAFAGAAIYSAKKAGDLQQQLNVFQATANASGREMKSVSALAIKLGNDVKLPATSAKDAADAMTELAKGGLSVRDSMAAARAVLQLSAAAQISNADAATIVADNLNAFSLSGQQAARVADLLAASANATTASIPEMGDALKQSASVAHQLNIPIADLVAMLGELANKGIKGSDAGTSVRTMLQALVPKSKQAAAAMKQLGVDVFDQQGRLKPMRAIVDDYSHALQGLTREQQLTALKTIFGTDAIRAANIILGQGTTAYDRLHRKVTEHGAAQKLAEAQTKGFNGAVQALKSTLDTAVITIGQALLPMFTRYAQEFASFIAHLQATGQLDQFAHNFAHAVQTAVTVIGDLLRLGRPVVSLLIDIGHALNLGDATTIEAMVVAIGGFKIVSTIAPMLMTLAKGVETLGLAAATAPTLGALFADIGVGPVGLIAAAVGGLAAAFVILGDQESTEAQLARHNADAHKEQAAAIRDVNRAEQEAANKGLANQQAGLRVTDARQRVSDARGQLSTAEDLPKADPGRAAAIAAAHNEIRHAVLDERQAVLDAKAAHQDYNKSVAAQDKVNADRTTKAYGRLTQAHKDLASLEKSASDRQRAGANPRTDPTFQKAEGDAIANVTKRTQEYVQALARANTSDVSRQRLMHESTQITEKHAQGISLLIQSMQGIPRSVQSKLLLQGGQGALSQLGKLSQLLSDAGRHHTMVRILTTAPSAQAAIVAMRAVIDGVPPRKVMHIIHNADTAKQAIDQLHAAIDAIPVSKQVTVTTTHRDVVLSSGKHLPGAASGGKTSGPQLYVVGEDPGHPTEWIIPENPAHRGRAVDLLMDAAKHILPGAAKGHKHGAKSHKHGASVKVGGETVSGTTTGKAWTNLNVPAAIALGGVPFDTVQTAYDDVHRRYHDAAKASRDLWSKLTKAQADLKDAEKDNRLLKSGPYKGKPANHTTRDRLHKEISQLTRQHHTAATKVPPLKDDEDLAKAALSAARKTDERAKNLQTQINLQRDAMDDANKKHDQAAYDTARTKRQSKIADLIGLLRTSLSQVPRGRFTDYVRTLEEQLSTLGGPAALAGIKRGQAPPAVDDSQLGGEYFDASAPSDDQQADTSAAEAAIPAGFTADEAGKLAGFDEAIALDEADQNAGQEATDMGSRLSLLEQVLGEIRPGGGRPAAADVVAAVAGMVTQARSDIANLAGGSTGGASNPDADAILAQSQQRNADLQRSLDIANAWATAAGGPGDIGSGGPNARQVAEGGLHVHFESYVPPSPQQARELGGHVAAGFGYQGPRRAQRQKVGL